MKLLMLIIIFCAFYLSGCEKDNNALTEPEGTIEILPLAVGNQWIFDFEFYVNDTLHQVLTDSMIIDSTYEWQGNVWHVLKEQIGIYSSINFYRNTEDGLWMMHPTYQDTTAGLYFKYPAVPGDWWVNGRGDTMMVKSITDTINIPAGTFSGCYHYQFVGDNESEGMWLTPGVGWAFTRLEEDGGFVYLFMVREYRVE